MFKLTTKHFHLVFVFFVQVLEVSKLLSHRIICSHLLNNSVVNDDEVFLRHINASLEFFNEALLVRDLLLVRQYRRLHALHFSTRTPQLVMSLVLLAFNLLYNRLESSYFIEWIVTAGH